MDSPETLAVRWFFSDPGAKWVEGLNQYRAPTWANAEERPDAGFLQDEPRTFDRGANTLGYTGQSICGAPEVWERGGIKGVTPPCHYDAQGVCEECVLAWVGRQRLRVRLKAQRPAALRAALRARLAAAWSAPAGMQGHMRLRVRLLALMPGAGSLLALRVGLAGRAGRQVLRGGLPLRVGLVGPQGPDSGVVNKARRLKVGLTGPQGPDSGVVNKVRRLKVRPAAAFPTAHFPTVRSVTTTAWSSSFGTVTIPKPAGTAAGDVIILFTWEGVAGTTIARIPPGFSYLQTLTLSTSQKAAVSYKVAGASEPANYTVSAPGTLGMQGTILAIQNTGATLYPSSIRLTNTGTVATANGVTTSAGQNVCLLWFLSTGAAVSALPGAYTTIHTGATSGGTFVTLARSLVGPGATGNQTATKSSGSGVIGSQVTVGPY